MTETVAIGLITLAASLIGASIGALATFQVTKMSAAAERRKLIHTEKIRAYSNFIFSYIAFVAVITTDGFESLSSPGDKERHAYTQFHGAYSQALLVAPDPVEPALTSLLTATNQLGAGHESLEDLHRSFQDAANKMREDIQSVM